MLPYGVQQITEKDIEAVIRALKSKLLTTGPLVEKFEKKIAETTAAKYAVAVSSGTAALHLACLASGLGRGDVAIVPAISFLATANAVRYCGAEVLFCDVDPTTGLMTEETFNDAIEEATRKNLRIKVVLPVHITGRTVDLVKIKKVCASRKIKLIADSCHAIGGEYNGLPVGAARIEDMSTFSFHPIKTIVTGEGGAVTTCDEKIFQYLKKMRNHGMVRKKSKDLWVYELHELGYNYRLTDFQCALGISQLSRLKDTVKKRQQLVNFYNERIEELSEHLKMPKSSSQLTRVGWHLYSPRIDFKKLGVSRREFMKRLSDKGIGSQVHYIPINSQPYYKKRYGYRKLFGADTYYKNTLSLPLHNNMEEGDVRKVLRALKFAVSG